MRNQQQLEGDVSDEQLCRALADFETSEAAAAAVVGDEISDSALYKVPADVEDNGWLVSFFPVCSI